jgi:hypothetical protein
MSSELRGHARPKRAYQPGYGSRRVTGGSLKDTLTGPGGQSKTEDVEHDRDAYLLRMPTTAATDEAKDSGWHFLVVKHLQEGPVERS